MNQPRDITRKLLLSPVNLFSVILIIGFAVFLYWMATLQMEAYREHQVEVARSAVATVAAEFTRRIETTRKFLKIFAADNKDMLSTLVSNPDNGKLREQLKRKLIRYFPDLFSVTLATDKGVPLIEDFDGEVGDACISDMQHTAKTGEATIRVHPNSVRYHIDVMVRFDDGGKKYILFTSYDVDKFARLLHILSPSGHSLMVVQKERGSLIEITEQGDRTKISFRPDFRLKQSESERTLAEAKVENTLWTVIDMHDLELFENYSSRIEKQMFKIFVAFLAMLIYMWFIILRKEYMQYRLAEDLSQSNRQIKKLNKTLTAMATQDELTGLYNRHYLNQRIQEEWNRAVRTGRSLAVAMLDVDYFKQFNDSYGHQAGDKTLKQVAGVLSNTLRRANEIVARYGGEEFIILISDTSIEEASDRLSKLIVKIEGLKIPHQKSAISAHVTASIGMAIGEPIPSADVNDFVKLADEALYEAKGEGRNRMKMKKFES